MLLLFGRGAEKGETAERDLHSATGLSSLQVQVVNVSLHRAVLALSFNCAGRVGKAHPAELWLLVRQEDNLVISRALSPKDPEALGKSLGAGYV